MKFLTPLQWKQEDAGFGTHWSFSRLSSHGGADLCANVIARHHVIIQDRQPIALPFSIAVFRNTPSRLSDEEKGEGGEREHGSETLG